MALVKDTLKSGILAIINSPPATPAIAAVQWGAAYDAYAKLGMAGIIPGTFTGSEASQFAAAILPAFNNTNGTQVTAVAGFVLALTKYWMVPPVVYGVGAVTAITGLAALSTMFSTAYSSADAAASNIATFLDTCTKTVIVTLPGPTLVTLT